ncbi:MAG: pseudouridine-5'-phosphate glycosidase [Gemmataceae bacterium]|nr:pseudouridine-5'-phosphate glycosidase [Gemmataceae bacterium]
MDRSLSWRIRPEVAEALGQRRPVVALESTLISHGLPWPLNLETAKAAEAAVRHHGAVPATIAVLDGVPVIGLDDAELERIARNRAVLKASRRDLPYAIARKLSAATTVAATMLLAHRAGIRLFATGGIGGAHREHNPWDISADVTELARTPVAVVCSGAKSVLDIPKTLEILETHGIPVVGYGTEEFPAFFVTSSGERLTARVDTPRQAADLLRANWELGGAGVVIAQPIERHLALDPGSFLNALSVAERQAMGIGVRGKELTPFLLNRIAEITEGQTLKANHALVVANARLAAQIAVCLET